MPAGGGGGSSSDDGDEYGSESEGEFLAGARAAESLGCVKSFRVLIAKFLIVK